MQFRSFSLAFVTLTAVAVAAGGGCQGPDKFLRDGGALQGGGGHAGTGTFAGTAGSAGGTGGHAGGGGGSTFAGTGGTPAGTGGHAGGGGGGSPGTDGGAGTGGPQPCPSCQIAVEYKCGNVVTAGGTSTDSSIRFTFRLVNNASTAVPFTNITVRYWFTANGATPKMECYYASLHDQQGSSANVTGSFHTVSPALPGADTYLEVGFQDVGTAPAGSLDGFHSYSQDAVQIEVHDSSYATNMTVTDDYSIDCSMGAMEIEQQKITAYVGGVLKFGMEPQ